MSVKPAALWHHFSDLEHQHDANVLGMWVFLATEIMIFGALFTAYTVFRLRYAPSFEDASRHLNLLIGGVNTVVLLTSSLTMAMAVRVAHLGRQKALVRYLILTVVLGTAFLALKAVEYFCDYRDRLVPGLAFEPSEWRRTAVNPEHVKLFLVFYFVMTGLHAVHMIVGMSVLLVLIVMAWRGKFSAGYSAPVEMWGLYWHFVDVVWIFLLPLLYLIGTRTGFY
jgi:cytochrome c oxidase subunit 3